MAHKTGKTTHPSVTCDGVTFFLFSKTYGRKIELDQKVAAYNQQIRELSNKRSLLIEEARNKAFEKLMGAKAAEPVTSVIKIGADGSGDMTKSTDEIEASPQFRVEMLRALNLRDIAAIDEEINSIALAQQRPLYMDVYLHSVEGLVDDDDNPLNYKYSMGKSDKERFYHDAPAELIDEIFGKLADHIEMTSAERANFGLLTTGGAQAVSSPAKDGTASNAGSEGSGSSATAA